MSFIRFDLNQQYAQPEQQCLAYLAQVDWGAAKKLRQTIIDGTFVQNFGRTAKLYFLIGTPDCNAAQTQPTNQARSEMQIKGFGAIVEQDYLPLPDLSPWISSIWVDPKYRGEHLSSQIVEFLEAVIRTQGESKVYILTQHQGLYERYGYTLIQEMPEPMHDHDYLYQKELSPA